MINNLKIKNLYYLNKISLIFIITYSNELNIYFTLLSAEYNKIKPFQ